MVLLRSTRLQKFLIFLLPLLLTADPFYFIKQSWGGDDEIVICSPQYIVKLSAPGPQPQIKCKFDTGPISTFTYFMKIISTDYILGTSFNLFSTDLITNPDRGPPSFPAIPRMKQN